MKELFAFLEKIGARPKKGLSQNFLIDQNIVRKIVHLAEVKPGDKVIEIGPGPGALTEELLKNGAHVLAIEKDTLFAQHLPRLQTSDNRLTVICADILEFSFAHLSQSPWKVVANLPYQITTPILEKLCSHSRLFSSFTLMVQKEFADRIKANPGNKTFGSLTLFLQFYTSFFSSFTVSPSCFYPSPKVYSSVIRLDTHPTPAIEADFLFPLIRKAFQQRRKMLTSSLRSLGKEIGAILISLEISPKARPEELSLEKWIQFSEKLLQRK